MKSNYCRSGVCQLCAGSYSETSFDERAGSRSTASRNSGNDLGWWIGASPGDCPRARPHIARSLRFRTAAVDLRTTNSVPR
jgi:hypothetical protein